MTLNQRTKQGHGAARNRAAPFVETSAQVVGVDACKNSSGNGGQYKPRRPLTGTPYDASVKRPSFT
ncbi:hypothetical protein PSAC2689_20384 [Paraburkholderia sacchari]